MNPIVAILLLLGATFGITSGSRKRRKKVTTHVKTTARKSSRSGSPKRRTNSKGQYLDGRGKPYTPFNAPNWLREIWAKRKRNRKKSKK